MRAMIVATVGFATALSLVGCAADDEGAASSSIESDPSGETPDAVVESVDAAGRHVVVYEATGSGPIDVTYGKGDGGPTLEDKSVSLDGVVSPWSMTLDAPTLAVMSVTVSSTEDPTGEVGCRISVDGREVDKQSTVRGDLPVTQCLTIIE